MPIILLQVEDHEGTEGVDFFLFFGGWGSHINSYFWLCTPGGIRNGVGDQTQIGHMQDKHLTYCSPGERE